MKTKKNKQRPARQDYCRFCCRSHLACADKAARKAEWSKPHNLKVDDILISGWDSDQTNIDYYEVPRVVSAKSVEIQKIVEHSGGEDGFMTAECWPAPGRKPKAKRAGRRRIL